MATNLYVVNIEWAGSEIGDLIRDGSEMRVFGTDAFADIQSAVNAADPAGSVIEVREGTYAGDVTLNKTVVGEIKKNLTIKAADGADVDVTGVFQIGRLKDPSATDPAVEHDWNGGLTIEGIHFDSSEHTSLQINIAHNVIVSECTFKGDAGNYMVNVVTNSGGTGNILFDDCEFGIGYVQIQRASVTDGRGIEFRGCEFVESTTNIQYGYFVEFNDCGFTKTVTDEYAADNFYVVRSGDQGVVITSSTFNIDSTASVSAPSSGKQWSVLWQKDGSSAWTVSDVEVNFTEAAADSDGLKFNINATTDEANAPSRITFNNLTTAEGSAADVADLLEKTSGYALTVTDDTVTLYDDGDALASSATSVDLFVNSAWAGSKAGTEVAEGKYYNINAFSDAKLAMSLVSDETESITVDGLASVELTENLVFDPGHDFTFVGVNNGSIAFTGSGALVFGEEDSETEYSVTLDGFNFDVKRTTGTTGVFGCSNVAVNMINGASITTGTLPHTAARGNVVFDGAFTMDATSRIIDNQNQDMIRFYGQTTINGDTDFKVKTADWTDANVYSYCGIYSFDDFTVNNAAIAYGQRSGISDGSATFTNVAVKGNLEADGTAANNNPGPNGFGRFDISKPGTLVANTVTFDMVDFRIYGSFTMDTNSLITVSNAWTNTGTFTVDYKDTAVSYYKIVDYTGTSSLNYGTVNTAEGISTLVYDKDLYVTNADMTELAVNSAWGEGVEFGETVTLGGKSYLYGINGFATIPGAAAVAKPGVETTINLSGELAGTANFNYGQDVVLTGTAAINWRAGWLFVGRDGTGTDRDAVTTVTVRDATISSINPQTYNASTGFHVSGYDTRSGKENVNNGVLNIEDSTITCDYLYNRNLTNISNSTATFVNLCVYGKGPGEAVSETTATLNITDDSTVTVTAINGMPLGNVWGDGGYGVINVEDTSDFIIDVTNTTGHENEKWTISDEGTLNLTGTATFTYKALEGGAVVNNGAINMAAGNTFTATSLANNGSLTIFADNTAEITVGSFTNSGAITIDVTGITGNTADVIIVTSDTGTAIDKGAITLTGEGASNFGILAKANGGISVAKAGPIVYVNEAWKTKGDGESVELTPLEGTATKGIDAFAYFDDAAFTAGKTIYLYDTTNASTELITGKLEDSVLKAADGEVGITFKGTDTDINTLVGDLTIGKNVTFGATKFVHNALEEDAAITVDGTFDVLATTATMYEGTMTVNGKVVSTGSAGALVIREGYSLVVNKGAEVNVNTRIYDATVTLTNASMAADLTIANSKGVVNVVAKDLGMFSATSIENSGTINLVITEADIDKIDVTKETYKLINITGTGAALSTSGITVNGEAWSPETTKFVKTVGGVDYTYRLMQFENDICLSSIDVDPAQVYVNSAWATGYEYGQRIAEGKYYLINAFATMSEATTSVNSNAGGTITIEAVTVGAKDANVPFTVAGTYTITGGNVTDKAPMWLDVLAGGVTLKLNNAIYTVGKFRGGRDADDKYVHSDVAITDSIIGAISKDGAGGGWMTFYDTSLTVSNSIVGAWLAGAQDVEPGHKDYKEYYDNATTMPRSASAVKAAVADETLTYLPYGKGYQGQNFGVVRDATFTNTTFATGFFDVRDRGEVKLDNSLVYVGGSLAAGYKDGTGGNWAWGNKESPKDYRVGEKATITLKNGSIIRNIGYGDGGEGAGLQIGGDASTEAHNNDGIINVTEGSELLMDAYKKNKANEDANIYANGELNINGKSKVSARNLTNAGTIALGVADDAETAGTLTAATLTNSGAINAYSGSTIESTGALTNSGSISLAGESTMTTGAITNSTNGSISADNSTIAATSIFTYGSFTATNNSEIKSTSTHITNLTTFNVTDSTVSASGSFLNGRDSNKPAAKATFTNATLIGSVTNYENATLSLTDSAITRTWGTITNNGTFKDLGGSTITIKDIENTGKFSIAGTAESKASTLKVLGTLTGTIELLDGANITATINAGGTFNVGKHVETIEEVETEVGNDVTFTGKNVFANTEVVNAGNILIKDDSSISAKSIANNGTITAIGTSTIDADIVNAQTVNFGFSTEDEDASLVTTYAKTLTGRADINGEGTNVRLTGTMQGSATGNTGTLLVNEGATLTVADGGVVKNYGSLIFYGDSVFEAGSQLLNFTTAYLPHNTGTLKFNGTADNHVTVNSRENGGVVGTMYAYGDLTADYTDFNLGYFRVGDHYNYDEDGVVVTINNSTINAYADLSVGKGYIPTSTATLNLNNTTATVGALQVGRLTWGWGAGTGYEMKLTNTTITAQKTGQGAQGTVIIDAGNTLTMDTDSQIKFFGTWTNEGTLSVNVDGKTGAYCLVDNTGSSSMELADYGKVTLVGSGSDDFDLQVIENDLWAINTGSSKVLYVNNTWTTHIVGGVEVPYEYSDPIDGREGLFFELNAFNNAASAIAAMGPLTTNLKFENNNGTSKYTLAGYTNLTQSLTIDSDAEKTALVGAEVRFGVDTDTPPNADTVADPRTFTINGNVEFDDMGTGKYGDTTLNINGNVTVRHSAWFRANTHTIIAEDASFKRAQSGIAGQLCVYGTVDVLGTLDYYTEGSMGTTLRIGSPSYTLPGILNVTGSAASLNIHADAEGKNYYAPKIESNGFLNVKEGATATFSGEVKNEGTITVSGKSTLTASKVTNTGSFTATGTADAKATVTAAIDNDVDATVEMTDVVFNKNTDSVNKGEWTVKDSSLTSYSVTNYDANSTFSAEDSTITMSRITNNGSFDVDGGAINTKKLQNAGTFTVKESDFTVSGQDGEALTNSGSFSFTAAEGKKFSAAKIVNSEDGLVTLTGDFTAEGALTIGELEGALTFEDVALKNFTLASGTVIVDGTANNFTGSNSFADLEVASDASLTATGISADTITNAGTITADSGIINAETAITNGVAATETTGSVKGTIIATALTAATLVNNNGAAHNGGSTIELTGDLVAGDIMNGVAHIVPGTDEPADKAVIIAKGIVAGSITNFGTVGSQIEGKELNAITLNASTGTGKLTNGLYGNVFASTLNAASIENEGGIVVENINITSTDGVIDNKAGGKIAQDNESMTIVAKAIDNVGYISTHGGAITATAITNGAYDDKTNDGLIATGSISAGSITNKGMIVVPTITAAAIENNGGSIIVTNGTISSKNDIKNTGNGTLSLSKATVSAPWIANGSGASVTAEDGSVINASINNSGLVMISDSTLSVARVYATQTTAAQFVVTGDSALTITDAFKGTISLIDANLTDASVKFTGGDYADGTVVVDAGTDETTFNGVSSFGNLSVAEGAMLSIVDTNVEEGAIVGPCLTVNGDFSIAGTITLDVTAFDSILAEGKTAQVVSVLGNITNTGDFDVTDGYQVIVQNDGIYVLRSSEPVEVDTICVNQAWKDNMQPGETFEFAGVDCVYGLNAFQNTNEILNLTDYTEKLIFTGGTSDAYKPLVLSTGGEIELQVVKSTGSGVTGVAFEKTTVSNGTEITGITATSIDFGKLTVEDGSVLFFGEDAAEIIQTVTAGETTITDSFVDLEGDITITGDVKITNSCINNDEDLKTSSTTINGNVKITDSDVDFDGEATIIGDVEITNSEVEFDRNTTITGLVTLDADSTIEADQGFSFEINNTSANKAKINGDVLATNKDDENPSGSTNVDLGFITGTGKIYTDINADLSFEGDYTGTLFIDVTGLEGDAGKKFATVSSDIFTIKVTGTNVADDPDRRKLFKKYFSYSRNSGLTQIDGACNVIEAEGKTAAAILTAVNHSWEGADGETYYSDNVLVNGCSSGTVYLQGNSSEQYITLSGSYTVGVYGGKECLETTARGGEDLGGDINIFVEGEDTVFTKVLVAGDRVNVASGRAEYYRESDINLTINGGTFKNYVAAGMMYQGVNVSGYAEIANTNLTISAGTFELNKDGLGGVFGGNYSNKKAGSVKTTVTGLSSVKIIAGEGDIVMAPALYAGSYGAGAVGATIVTFEGEQKEGQKLQFKQIWGGSSSDKIIRGEKETGNGTYEGSVAGARTLSFTGFTGTIECSSIAGFSHVIVNDSVATLTANDMSAVENWEFDVDSKLIGTGAFTNDFKGDTFKFGTADDIENLAADFSWNVFEGIGDLNGTFGGFEKVTLFGETASWDNVSSYASTNYTLSLQTIGEGEAATTNMVVAAKLA